MTKKECRRRPTAANQVETLDSGKKGRKSPKKKITKKDSHRRPTLRAGLKLWILEKGPKMTKKNVTADPQLRVGSKLWIQNKGPKMTKKE